MRKARARSKPRQPPRLLPPRDTRFKPGNTIGSTGTTMAKIQRDLKQGVVAAAEIVGYDGKGHGGIVGYLTMLAEDHPKLFAPLLGRVIPLQVQGNLGTFIGAVNIVSVPNGKYMSPEDIKQRQREMEGDGGEIIDAEPLTPDEENVA